MPWSTTSSIARGEAMECAASLDVMKLRKLTTEERDERGAKLLEGVVVVLTKMS
ncbi:MAG: hypothetical protein KBG28_12115 [Kofleriaceae bacterium]|nr:hypothetical protein [Kofleriaceae bacterium]MBP6840875.1 hypothetical protein [Kofleriaceae bacterium]MBP9204704.1 hypothetical protein [Kofleriaceae bacterium]